MSSGWRWLDRDPKDGTKVGPFWVHSCGEHVYAADETKPHLHSAQPPKVCPGCGR